jgi:hypothetical protein
MNKSNWHVVLVAASSALVLGLITMATPLLPVFEHGAFPTMDQIKPACASAIGEVIKALIVVGSIYAGKIRLMGSSTTEPPKA